MRVLFRVDGGKDIGLGNVYRTLALAHQLELSGFGDKADMLFLTGYSSQACDLVKSERYHAEHIGKAALVEEMEVQRRWSQSWQPRCIVIDVPDEPDRPLEFFESLRWSSEACLVNLSDCNSGRHHADLVVEADAYRYEDPSLASPGRRTRYLRGPKYWIMNPAFAKERADATDNLDRKGIFVGFGGSDPSQLSLKITALAQHLSQEILPVTLVLGGGVDFVPEIPPGWHVLHALCPTEMAITMHKARVGIISGGLIMYEAACMGLPSLVIVQNAGQEKGARAFEALNVHEYLGHADRVSMQQVIHLCTELFCNMEMWQERSQKAMKLIDGKGAQRVINALAEEIG